MESRAKSLGRALVEEERKLDRLFATKAVTPELLNSSLNEIGSLQAKVRAAHLEAHLTQFESLRQSRMLATPSFEATAALARKRVTVGSISIEVG